MKSEDKQSLTKGDNKRESIRLAALRIEKGRPRIVDIKRKLSINSVAEEAGMSAASIHNNYPDMAEWLRQKIGVDLREQKNTMATALKESKSTNRALKDENSELKKEIALLASHNATLMLKNSELTAIAHSDNVKLFPSK
ncbi:TetR family transcriptional regulator [Pseudomonas siliginis]|uniref:TetR family transcriptional regulator n=1 Tax=Pseudomonas siliginis TaxID=2842346 RepID=UPI002B2408E6|nr:TetR family transcriptional regulator [Pseudomonas siliginis]MEB2651469.1 TetR family transcriptional regulator [Pseudomonas siliginis]